MYKPLADSTLMSMTKKEIIEHLRVAEHNHQVCVEQIDQQYKNCIELLKKERANTIDECIKTLAKDEDTMLTDKQYYTLQYLKEQKNG